MSSLEIQGSMVYIVSDRSNELIVVHISEPRDPYIIARISLDKPEKDQ